MIRHLVELSALLLCFVVGVGLVAAFVIGLLWIWDASLSAQHENREVHRIMVPSPPTPVELISAWLDSEPFTGDAAWPLFVRAFPFDWERE